MQLLQVCPTERPVTDFVDPDTIQQVCLADYFDADYFENGVQTGKSCYENYHYMPERSEKTAEWLHKKFGDRSILDFGCAKGFLVKALRDKWITAYGYDISEYAVTHCLPDVEGRLFTDYNAIPKCEVVVGKDVLEHIPKSQLGETLRFLAKNHRTALFVVPLGDNGEYRIPEYHLDKSHLIAECERWWMAMFLLHGWELVEMNHDISPFKEHWLQKHKYGNAVFTLRSIA